MGKHRKRKAHRLRSQRVVIGTASVSAAMLVAVVLSAASFASQSSERPEISFKPIVRAAENLKPHPVILVNDFSGPQSIVVKKGDTLSSIAKRVLGKANRWPLLWWENRRKVHNPNMLLVGTRLYFDARRTVRPWLAERAMDAIPKPKPAPAASDPIASTTVASQPVTQSTNAQPVSYGGSGYQGCVISRESGGNPAAYNPASGAGGLYQFLPSTWASTPYGPAYPGGAQTAPVAVQNAAYAWLYARSGSSPWSSDGC